MSGGDMDEVTCYDCQRRYGDEHGFPDLVVPDDVWKVISPTKDEGGLLCPSCICKRLRGAKFENVRAVFTSGPIAAYHDLDALRQRCEAAEQRVADGSGPITDDLQTRMTETLGPQVEYPYPYGRMTWATALRYKLDEVRTLAAQVEELTKRLRHCNCCGKDVDISDPENAPVFVKCAACDTKDCDKLTAANEQVEALTKENERLKDSSTVGLKYANSYYCTTGRMDMECGELGINEVPVNEKEEFVKRARYDEAIAKLTAAEQRVRELEATLRR